MCLYGWSLHWYVSHTHIHTPHTVIPTHTPALSYTHTNVRAQKFTRKHMRRCVCVCVCVCMCHTLQLDMYYNGFCNSVLWQLFHYVPLNIDSWLKMSEHKAMQMQWQAYQVRRMPVRPVSSYIACINMCRRRGTWRPHLRSTGIQPQRYSDSTAVSHPCCLGHHQSQQGPCRD